MTYITIEEIPQAYQVAGVLPGLVDWFDPVTGRACLVFALAAARAGMRAAVAATQGNVYPFDTLAALIGVTGEHAYGLAHGFEGYGPDTLEEPTPDSLAGCFVGMEARMILLVAVEA